MEYIGDVFYDYGGGLYAAFDEILRFTEEVKQCVPDVTMSVVGFSIPQQDIEDCRRLAQNLGVKFRVR